MTNRKLAYIVKDQSPLTLPESETVAHACNAMLDRKAGTVLVTDAAKQLTGIFTGRDAVRLLAGDTDASAAHLAEVMTRDPVTAAPQHRAVDALRVMAAGGFRHVPVVAGNRIVGIVSRGDFRGMEFEHHRWCEHGCVSGPGRRLGDIVAGQKPLLHKPRDQVRAACRSMTDRGLGSALVVGRGARLVGVFTGRDAVRLLATTNEPAHAPLEKAMTPEPVTLGPDGQAIDALRVMSNGGFRHLPIVADGKVLGVVSLSDFTGCEIDRLEEEQHLAECIW
jgi:CBS domain-containing protein